MTSEKTRFETSRIGSSGWTLGTSEKYSYVKSRGGIAAGRTLVLYRVAG
jgi:hypothetical protein